MSLPGGHSRAAASIRAPHRMADGAAPRSALPAQRPILAVLVLGGVAFGSALAVAEEAAIRVDAALARPAAGGAPPASGPSLADEARYRAMLVREAERLGVPPALADAVAFVESGYRPDARGAVGELGLMQVRPQTAAMLGHTGPAEALLDPETNIRFGVAYLAQAWALAKGDLCRTLMKYRAGHGEERMSALSVGYCIRTRIRLAATGSSLAAAVPPASTGGTDERPPQPQSGRLGRQAVRAALAGRFWAEHVARVRAIEAKSDRIMRGG